MAILEEKEGVISLKMLKGEINTKEVLEIILIVVLILGLVKLFGLSPL